MVAGADVRVDAETLADDALAFLGHAFEHRRYTPGSIQLALALGDDDLRSLVCRGQGRSKRTALSIGFLLFRFFTSAREDGMYWPPVAAE